MYVCVSVLTMHSPYTSKLLFYYKINDEVAVLVKQIKTVYSLKMMVTARIIQMLSK